jgi:hypothetical protein
MAERRGLRLQKSKRYDPRGSDRSLGRWRVPAVRAASAQGWAWTSKGCLQPTPPTSRRSPAGMLTWALTMGRRSASRRSSIPSGLLTTVLRLRLPHDPRGAVTAVAGTAPSCAACLTDAGLTRTIRPGGIGAVATPDGRTWLPDGMPTFRPIPVGRNNCTQQNRRLPGRIVQGTGLCCLSGRNSVP